MLSVSETVPRMLPLALACFLLAFQTSNILGDQPVSQPFRLLR